MSVLEKLVCEPERAPVSEGRDWEDYQEDLLDNLSRRLVALGRYRRYLVNARGQPAVQAMWQEFRQQELANIRRLKQMIAYHIQPGCF